MLRPYTKETRSSVLVFLQISLSGLLKRYFVFLFVMQVYTLINLIYTLYDLDKLAYSKPELREN